ncbi:hypothetical protein JR316_0002205 [Psilocybe cubensis]|uniref:Uncharacterized protein n=2 Tax=Psilocybe cubensis TaxID=181762 RepID=A0A8H8CQ28_PSICU|nr:hypothetical protein JR316_0002205 [Psilocybe cubensis]KAH9485297.1 hypothetical protein JR316_0002205 [Psilocybe cubensis]
MDDLLGEPDANAIATTVALLRSMAHGELAFNPAQLTLRGESAEIYQLALKAHSLALEHTCSSILAGQGSESDDAGDVGFHLGEGDYSKAENVLKALSLPVTQTTTMNRPDGWTETLQNEYYFRIAGPNSRYIFFLVGQTDTGGWGGLVGAGVWT